MKSIMNQTFTCMSHFWRWYSSYLRTYLSIPYCSWDITLRQYIIHTWKYLTTCANTSSVTYSYYSKHSTSLLIELSVVCSMSLGLKSFRRTSDFMHKSSFLCPIGIVAPIGARALRPPCPPPFCWNLDSSGWGEEKWFLHHRIWPEHWFS